MARQRWAGSEAEWLLSGTADQVRPLTVSSVSRCFLFHCNPSCSLVLILMESNFKSLCRGICRETCQLCARWRSCTDMLGWQKKICRRERFKVTGKIITLHSPISHRKERHYLRLSLGRRFFFSVQLRHSHWFMCANMYVIFHSYGFGNSEGKPHELPKMVNT